jgi:hypothetical protein
MVSAPTGFLEIVSDDFPVFHAIHCATAALRRAITEMGTSASKSVGQKNQKAGEFPSFSL